MNTWDLLPCKAIQNALYSDDLQVATEDRAKDHSARPTKRIPSNIPTGKVIHPCPFEQPGAVSAPKIKLRSEIHVFLTTREALRDRYGFFFAEPYTVDPSMKDGVYTDYSQRDGAMSHKASSVKLALDHLGFRSLMEKDLSSEAAAQDFFNFVVAAKKYLHIFDPVWDYKQSL